MITEEIKNAINWVANDNENKVSKELIDILDNDDREVSKWAQEQGFVIYCNDELNKMEKDIVKLTLEQEIYLVEKARRGDIEARNMLITCHMDYINALIYKKMSKISDRSEINQDTVTELRDECIIYLMEHLDKFTYARGRLSVFISNVVVKDVCIKNPEYESNGKIQMIYKNSKSSSRLIYFLANKITDFISEYQQTYGERPSDTVIADKFGITVDKVQKALQYFRNCKFVAAESSDIDFVDDKESEMDKTVDKYFWNNSIIAKIAMDETKNIPKEHVSIMCEMHERQKIAETTKELAKKYNMAEGRIRRVDELVRKRLRNAIINKLDLAKFYQLLISYNQDLADRFLLNDDGDFTSKEYQVICSLMEESLQGKYKKQYADM